MADRQPQRKRRSPRWKRGSPHPSVALCYLFAGFGGSESYKTNLVRGPLQQHVVPPFRLFQQTLEIPSCKGGHRCQRESMIQDVFHTVHVRQQHTQQRRRADAVFRHVARQTGQNKPASSSPSRRTVREGPTRHHNTQLFEEHQGNDQHTGSEGDYGGFYRLLGFTPSWNDTDYVITAELEYNDGSNNNNNSSSTTPTGSSSPTIANATGESGNQSTTSSDGSSSVYTKVEPNANSTTNNTDPNTGNNSTDPWGPSSEEDDNDGELFRPIRMRAVLSESHGGGEHLEGNQLPTLLEQMVRPALLAWSEALRVPKVAPGQNLTLDPAQWVDGTTCGPGLGSGLPTAHVPFDHLEYGVPDTDLVVYLNLGFVYEPDPEPTINQNGSPKHSNNTRSPAAFNAGPSARPSMAPSTTSSPSLFTMLPTTGPVSPPTQQPSSMPTIGPSEESKGKQHNKNKLRKVTETITPSPSPESTANLTDASEAPSVTSFPSEAPSPPAKPRPRCAGDYLASSVFCSTNEFDRPTAAMLHICISPDFFEPDHLTLNILTIMHELGHALGFNLQSLAHFRRSDGTPITPRDPATGAIQPETVECTGPQLSQGRPTAKMILPSEELLQFREVRGGVRVAEVVTPSVAQVVRNHFDCQELNGAELESGEALPFSTNPGEMSCIGNHWERRLFKTDLMNPIVDGLSFDPLISILTLAYFADSGWYQVDLSRASVPAIWGRAAGCEFVEEQCIQANGQIVSGSDSIFCNSITDVDDQGFVTTLDGCTADMTKKAACTMSQYEGELPPQYQYFSTSYGANVGGLDPFMDYCPVYNGLKNGLCSDPNNKDVIQFSPTERVGSRNSRCLSGVSAASPSPHSRVAMCLRIACVVADKSMRVQVDGQWQTCAFEGQSFATSNGNEQVFCPDPIRVCPTFYCPRDCLGTEHICDYSLGACVCQSHVGGSTVVQLPLEDGSCPDFNRDPINPSIGGGNPPPESGDSSGSSDPGPESQQAPNPSPTDPPKSNPHSNFYIPPEEAGVDPAVPKTGTPLGDIYFPDERTLEETEDQHEGDDTTKRRRYSDGEGSGEWRWALLGILVLVLPVVAFASRLKEERPCDSDDANDGGDGDPVAILPTSQRRNKDKMIATVLVDLRMNDPRMNNFRDVLVQRGSETDHSMTDTDPGTVVPWDEQSSREQMETANELPSILEPIESRIETNTFPTTHNNFETPTTILNRPSPRGNSTMRRRFFRRRPNYNSGER